MRNACVVVMLVMMLSSCGGILYPGTYGNSSVNEETISKIIPYKTNKYEVQALLGKPMLITKSTTGDVIWSYEYMKYFLNTYTDKVAEIVIGRDGIVKECRYREQSS